MYNLIILKRISEIATLLLHSNLLISIREVEIRDFGRETCYLKVVYY